MSIKPSALKAENTASFIEVGVTETECRRWLLKYNYSTGQTEEYS